MTREESIEILKKIPLLGTHKNVQEKQRAICLAISALEQQPSCNTCRYLDENECCTADSMCGADDFASYRPIKQQPCEDAVSREDVIKLVEFSGYDLQFGIDNADMCDDVRKLPSVTPSVMSKEDFIYALKSCEYTVHNGQVMYEENELIKRFEQLPSVTVRQTGECKDCKYFEYDSVKKVDGIPLIVAHEICNKWGGGCKTKEDGYCYLFEPQESEDKE